MVLKKLAALLLLPAILLCLTAQQGVAAEVAGEGKIIRYPRLSTRIDPQSEYILEILRLAVKHSGQTYQLQPSADLMQQARSIYELTSSHGRVDILWTMSTDEREAQILPIRIPLDKGLIGWRIALLTKTNRDLLKNVKSAHDLAAFSAGQELDWPDTSILQSNGLPVKTSASYEPLFNMLAAGRFDYFPRSVLEIQNEFDAHPEQNLHMDTHILLHYPAAMYFFVTPRDPGMARDIQTGLEASIRNGSFEKTFQRYQKAVIRNLNLKQRTVINLRNPLLSPDKMPLKRSQLWFNID